MDAKERKCKRVQLLTRQLQLDEEHCAACPVDTSQNNDGCVGCPVFAELRAIGRQLDQTVKAEFVPPEDLTFSVYTHMKERGWADSEIMKMYKIGSVPFQKFRDAHMQIRGN